MSTSDSKAVVDHVSDLSSAKEPILFLSFLFLETDLLLEVGILNDLAQSRSNPCVQHFKISLPLIERDDFKSSTEWTISTSLILHIAPTENRNMSLPGFGILSSNMKTSNVWEICQTEAPIFAVFADHP